MLPAPLQDQWVGLAQAPFKGLLLPWILECASSLLEQSLFSVALLAFLKVSLLAFKAKNSRGFIFSTQDRAKEHNAGLGPFSPS